MKPTNVTILIAVLATTFASPALAHGDDPHGTIPYHHIAAPLGPGIVRTYVTSVPRAKSDRGKRKPDQIGVEIPLAVMNALPTTATSMAIELPRKAGSTPFQFLMLDWNPDGHIPAGIYDLPHFDFHFYIQDFEDVMDIKPGPCSGLDCEDFQRAVTPVPSQFVPADYVDLGAVVPYMGNHLLDVTSPEFNGQPFTRTWIYGAYDGEVTFYEPMITRQSLVGQPNQCTAVKLPLAYNESGYYPTKYCTQFDARKKTYRIFMTGFVYRQAQ